MKNQDFGGSYRRSIIKNTPRERSVEGGFIVLVFFVGVVVTTFVLCGVWLVK